MPVASNLVFPSFPGLVALPASRTAIWSTLRPQLTVAGVDVSQVAWTYPRYRYKVGMAYLRSSLSTLEFQTLMNFYNRVNGSNDIFQYTDPFDNAAGPDQPFGTGNGVQTAFQLLRGFGFPSITTRSEPVFAVNTVTNIKINNVVQSGGTYSVSNKGVVTFNSAPGAGLALTWTGTFLWFCKFDADEMEFAQITAPDLANTWGAWFNATLQFTTQKFGS